MSKHLISAGVTDEQRIVERRDRYGRIAFGVSMRHLTVPEITWEDAGQLTRDRFGAIAEAVIDAFVASRVTPGTATTPRGDEEGGRDVSRLV